MMKRHLLGAAAILVAFGFSVRAGTDRGVPLLTDDFSMKETFPERWRVGDGQALRFRHGDGALHADGKECVVEASLLKELPDNFWIESEIVYESDIAKDYWAGFAIDGHLFLTLQGRTWLHPSVSCVDGGKQVVAEGYEKGRPMRIAVSRQKSGETYRYAFYLDGRAAGSFVATAPATKAPFAFRVWNCAVAFRRFALCALKTGDASPNLVYNASCERIYDDEEGIPQLINVWRHFPFGKEPIESYETRYLGAFRTDTSEKHSGERSVRVDINECMFEPVVWPWGTGSVQDQPGVFSVWMKSSVDGLPVKLEYGGVWNHVKVTREWARYSVFNPSLPKLGPYSPVRVAVVNPDRTIRATLWLDDFQAEIGTEPTPFQLSDLDKDMFTDRTVEERAKGFDVPELPKGVKPTADLDAWSRHAVLFDRFYSGTRKPTHRTEMYLACDREALYVGVRAFGEDPSGLKQPRTHRDDISIYQKDGLELFFSPNGARKWHHLMANANGAQTDLFGEDIKWNGEWTVEAKANATAGSVDYCVRIPARDFAKADLKDVWYVNFCRDDAGKDESQSMFRNVKNSYRDIDLWPEARFPQSVIAAWRRFAPAAAAAEAPKTEVVGRLNFYMNEPTAEYRIIHPDGTFETVKLPLADQPFGTNRVTLTAKDGTCYAAELVKLPYNRYATQINRFARCIERQGRKIFPIAKLCYLFWEPEYAAGIAELYGRFGGVNAILETVNGNEWEEKELRCKVAFDAALARMPDVYRIHEFQLVGPFLEGKTEATQQKARRLREFVREKFEKVDEDVLLTGVVDEPELVVPSEDCYELLKELHPSYPYRPMMMNSTLMGIPNNYANLETDILGLDDYLTASFGRTVADSLVNVDICSETGKRLHRPSFAALVSGNTPYNCREPSRAEQVAQCYGAFVGGINGFFLWGDLPYTRGDWEGNKQVCSEFAELTPYVLTEEPDPEVTVSESRKKLRRRCCRFGKTDTLVTVNVDERPIGTVTFTLPADRRDVKRVTVLFENREIAVRNGKFTDEFGALTRHVYRW